MTKIKSWGFSTVELLVTLIAISIVFGAFTTTFVTIQGINKQTNDVQAANNALFQKLQEYENTLFTSLPVTIPQGSLEEVEDFSDELSNTLPEPRVGKVYINSVSPTLKHVVVSVEYGPDATKQNFQHATFIQRDGFGQ
jgi:type II secretory pathway pseudopilin PulG